MQDSILLSFVTLSTTSLMILISGLLYYSEKDKNQWIVAEYWVAASCHIALAIITSKYGPFVSALTLLIWPWRVRTIRKILESAVGTVLFKSWHLKALLGSYILMLGLYFSGFTFLSFTLPVSLTVFIIILDMLVASRVRHEERLSLIHVLLQLNVFIIALHNLDYPFLRQHTHYSILANSVSLLTSILMAILLPAVVIYNLKEKRQKELEVILEKQSKLSTLGEMTVGIAHEINNPLGVIINRIELLKYQMGKNILSLENMVKGLDQIETTAKRVTDIIQALRKFSKIEKAESFSLVNLKDVIEETLTYCRDRFRLGNIELKVEAGQDFMITCRPVQISQIILNLLNNAYDAVKNMSGAWVDLSTTLEGRTVKVTVTDSGKGIPPEIRKNIMVLFFTTKDEDGTGLGLPLSRRMIEEHGGKLYYDDTRKNTTFVVEIPLSSKF